jgi:hypothetical protein
MSAQQMDDAFNSVDIRGQQMISRQQLADLWRILRQDFGQWLERPTTISDEELMRSPPNAMRMSRDADDDYDYRGRDAYIRMLNSPCGKYCCIIVPGFCGPAVMGVDLSCYMAGLPVSGCLTAFVCCLFSAINFYNANT